MVQRLGRHPSLQVVWIPALVRELRFGLLSNVAKKKKIFFFLQYILSLTVRANVNTVKLTLA